MMGRRVGGFFVLRHKLCEDGMLKVSFRLIDT